MPGFPARGRGRGCVSHVYTVSTQTLVPATSSRWVPGPTPPLRRQSPHAQVPRPPPPPGTSPVSWKAPSVFVPALLLVPRTPSSQLQAVLAKNKEKTSPMILSCLRDSCPALVCRSHTPANPTLLPVPPGQRLHCIVFNF